MREIATGVWHWKAPHPEWQAGQTWDRMVSSYCVDTGDAVLLFDPVDVPAELRQRATAVVLTCPWHRRDAPELGLPIHVPPPDPPDPRPAAGPARSGPGPWRGVPRRRHAAVRRARVRGLRAERPRPLRGEPARRRGGRHADRPRRWARGAPRVAGAGGRAREGDRP